MSIAINIVRDRIQFENIGGPADGNEQEHTRRAASAWEIAATRTINRHGHDGEAGIWPRMDHGFFGVYVAALDEDGESRDPTPQERAEGARVATLADEAGFAAAYEYLSAAADELEAEIL